MTYVLLVVTLAYIATWGVECISLVHKRENIIKMTKDHFKEWFIVSMTLIIVSLMWLVI